MNIHIVPQFEDNYGYLVYEAGSDVCAAIDVGEPKAVVEAAHALSLRIDTVLITHSHWDHAGGIPTILEAFPEAKIIAGKDDGVSKTTSEVWDGDAIQLGGITFKVLATPCHTQGHVCYLASHPSSERQAVFTGDTLFVAGCGKFNKGSPSDMHNALYKVLGGLPKDTLVYVGHEYTVSNLKFAHSIDTDNKDVADKLAWAQRERANGRPTIPSTIASEWMTNPFMRCNIPEIQHRLGKHDTVEALAEMRHRKNNWRPT